MLSRRLGAALPGWVQAAGVRGAAWKAETAKDVATAGSAKDVGAGAVKDVAAIQSEDGITTTVPGQAFVGDLRSTSALEVGDNIFNHTKKWLQGNHKSPMQYIHEAEPIKVDGMVVASYGYDDPALGCPVEYINLKGTSYENPAVCKYTGNKYFSDAWKGGGGH